MIVVNMAGRLGNQLFEYACARSLQEIYHEKIQININELKKYTDFRFELVDYRLNENIIIVDDKPLKWYMDLRSPIVRILKKTIPETYFNALSKFGIFVWQSTKYKKLPIISNTDKILNGWWQCDKYFNDIRNILLNEIVPKEDLLEHNRLLFNMIKSTESVCVTIRRGNYVEDISVRKKHFVCDKEYFQKAIEKMQCLVKDCTFFIFSDDIKWVKSNMVLPENSYYEIGNDPVWEKLRIMSACKHFIISNSTFSWWCQYLSTNDNNKKVIAPSKWYADGRKADIYQKNWILIDV